MLSNANGLKITEHKNQRYSIRKLSVGVASVLIGLAFIGTVEKPISVKADSINGNETSQIEKVEQKTDEIQNKLNTQNTNTAASRNKVVLTQDLKTNDVPTTVFTSVQKIENNLHQDSAVTQINQPTMQSANTLNNDNDISKQAIEAVQNDSRISNEKVINDNVVTISRTIHYREKGTDKPLASDVKQAVSFVPYNKVSTVKVNYIDSTLGKTLDTSSFSGLVGTPVGGENGEFKQAYLDKTRFFKSRGFLLDHNTFNYNFNRVFTENPQIFNVYFKHRTTPMTPDNPATPGKPILFPTPMMLFAVNSSSTLNDMLREEVTAAPHLATIFYAIVKDGTVSAYDLPESRVNSELTSIVSPRIAGYHLVDASQVKIPSLSVDLNSPKHTEEIVYYAKNPVEQGNLNVMFHDDTTNSNLSGYGIHTRNEDVGTKVTYSSTDDLKKLTDKGYVYVKTDGRIPGDIVKGTTNVVIHVKHGIDTKNTVQNITRTINYQYKDGSQAHEPVVQNVQFTGTTATDKVTGTSKTKWNQDNQEFASKNGVSIDGYHIIGYRGNTNATINKNSGTVGVETVVPDSKDINIVITYDKNEPVQVSGSIIYHDDTNNRNLEESNFTGSIGSKITYTTADKIRYYESNGYKLVSNNFKDGHEIYNTDPAKNVFVVHLAREEQHAVVIYQDVNDPNNPIELSRSNDLTGQPGTKINYSSAKSIKNYQGLGYVLVNNSFQNAVFDDNSKTVQTYYVTFKHGTENNEVTKDVKETVHYIGAGELTPKDHIQISQWSQNIAKDKITGKIISTSPWTISTGRPSIYDEVITLNVEGYIPDKLSIPAIQVLPKDLKYTVTYSKTPTPVEKGSLNIIFHDDTTNNDLTGYGTHTGKEDVGTKVTYNSTDDLKKLTDKGYEYVKTDGKIPDDIVKGTTNVVIHVKHGINNKNISRNITRIISYQYKEGSQAHEPVVQNVQFTGTTATDKVTGQSGTTWDQRSLDFAAKKGIKIDGYHIVGINSENSKATVNSTTGAVGAETVLPGNNNINIVITYAEDVPVQTTGSINYHDDTTDRDLEVSTFSGDVGSKISYTTTNRIKYYENNGYKLISNDFEDGHEIYNTDPAKNVFVVHLAHKVTPINDQRTVTRVINYHFSDGTTKPSVNQIITFKGEGYKDQVTGNYVTVDKGGKIVGSGDMNWLPNKYIFAATDFVAKGYTVTRINTTGEPQVVDQLTGIVGKSTVVPTSENSVIDIYLRKKPAPVSHTQHAFVVYQDVNDPNNPIELSRSNKLNGQPTTKIDYSTAKSIEDYQSKGYVLVNDGFQNAVFDNDSNVQTYYVTFKHGTESSTLTKDVKEIVHYVGAGESTPKDHIQTSQWIQTTTKDKVTGEMVENEQWSIAKDGKTVYDQVNTPVIKGYHPDKSEVFATPVTQNDIEITVTYTPNDKIIPGNPSDRPTPKVPTTPTDSKNSDKVVPNEPVPENPDMTPSTPKTISEDSGKESKASVEKVSEFKKQTIKQNNSAVTAQKSIGDKINNKKETLPQTGAKNNGSATILGTLAASIGMAFGIIGLVGSKRRKKNNK